MPYFRYFNKGYYDITGNGNKKLVTDLMTRVKVRSKILDEASLYDRYDVQNGDRPETISYYHFGSSDFHWVILLTNNITDAFYGWPLSNADFERYITDKYTNPEGIHHYEITQSSGSQTGNGPSDYLHKIEVNSTVFGAQSVSNREYEQRLQDEKRTIKLLNPSYLPILIEEFEKIISK
jgi:hypothetical protein